MTNAFIDTSLIKKLTRSGIVAQFTWISTFSNEKQRLYSVISDGRRLRLLAKNRVSNSLLIVRSVLASVSPHIEGLKIQLTLDTICYRR